MSYTLNIDCIGALLFYPFVCLSDSLLVNPLVLLSVLPPDGCIVVCLLDLLTFMFLNHSSLVYS